MAARPQLRRRRTNHGFGLMVFLSLLVAATLAFLATMIGPEALEAYRMRKTETALVQARDALVGYALQYRDQQIAAGTDDTAMYGHLPMPDMGESTNLNAALGLPCATEGCAKLNNSGTDGDGTYIGRFPWRTLSIEPLRDGHGECLWYIVSASHKTLENTGTVNWDTLGQLDVVVADGSDSLRSTVASAHDRPIAIIFSPGPPIPGQDRSTSAVDNVDQCGGNYNPANYLDPGVAANLQDATGTTTTESTYFAGNAETHTGDTSKLAISMQGDIVKASDDKLWPKNCPAGSNCTRVANDRGLALTPDTLFGSLRKNANYRTDINSLLDRIVGCLRDQIAAGGGPAGYSKIANDACYADSVVPLGYYSNYKDELFVLRGALTVNGMACPGALILANQRGPGQLRSTAAEQALPGNYLEDPNLSNYTGGGTSFSGDTDFNTLASGQTLQQDIVRCVPNSASFVTVNNPDVIADGYNPLANYDPGTRTLTLGSEGATTNNGEDGSKLYGCAWTPEVGAAARGLRAYFTFRFWGITGIPENSNVVGNNGFVFAAIDGTLNSSSVCGASGYHLGYSGDNAITDPIAAPKIGIEFDQSMNSARNDPPGGAYGNSHSAIVYWGDSSIDDDNVHGAGSSPNPHNPEAPSPGIALVDYRGRVYATDNGVTDDLLDSFRYHVRVEIIPLSAATTLSNARVAAVENINVGDPGETIDGVRLSANDRVVLTRQADATQNGVYVWHAADVAMTRAADADSATKLSDANVTVSEGNHAGIWLQANTLSDLATDTQTWLPAATKFRTQAWIVHDPGTDTLGKMANITRPMSQLFPGGVPSNTVLIEDSSVIPGVRGGECHGSCATGQTCGADDHCYRPGLQTIRLGFTNSQRTNDQRVTISDFFASWHQ